MRLFYTIGIWFYTLGIRLAALFGHRAARLMVAGWRVPLPSLNNQATTPVVWFHAASLGEFEQARPVLEAYRQRHPEHKVLLTFFSPSGYEVRKNYPLADAVCYLPPDLPHRVRGLLDTFNPTAAFFVKYEFWFNYLDELRRRHIPTYLFSAIFRPEQHFFRPWGGWTLRQLRRCYTYIFVQNTESLELLKSHGVTHCMMAGDTRFDRVHQIAVAAEGNEKVEAWLDGYEGNVLIGGSTWPPDETLISKLRIKNSEFRIILAPHMIDEEHLRQIEQLFPDSVRYSVLKDITDYKCHRVLIIDNIGMLSKLYRYADVAYIGGGFGAGIHNTLEAVTFGKPVFFGPNHHKFQEALDLQRVGGGWSVSDSETMATKLQSLFTDPDCLAKASQACIEYMQQNLGSTEIILNTIEK